MTDLDRLIQIEDIWTRRIIMEPIRNSERRAEFEAVKQLWRLWPTKPRKTAAEMAQEYNAVLNYTAMQGSLYTGHSGYIGAANVLPFGYGKQSL